SLVRPAREVRHVECSARAPPPGEAASSNPYARRRGGLDVAPTRPPGRCRRSACSGRGRDRAHLASSRFRTVARSLPPHRSRAPPRGQTGGTHADGTVAAVPPRGDRRAPAVHAPALDRACDRGYSGVARSRAARLRCPRTVHRNLARLRTGAESPRAPAEAAPLTLAQQPLVEARGQQPECLM